MGTDQARSDRCSVNSLIETPGCSPVSGSVRWDPVHSVWNAAMLLASVVLGPVFFAWDALLVFVLLTGASLLLGHSVGFHRRLIHRSFACPLWLERFLVWVGTCVGMSGPFWMIRTAMTISPIVGACFATTIGRCTAAWCWTNHRLSIWGTLAAIRSTGCWNGRGCYSNCQSRPCFSTVGDGGGSPGESVSG